MDVNELELMALEASKKYGRGSVQEAKGNKKRQIQFYYDDENGIKTRKSISLEDGENPDEAKLRFIRTVIKKKIEVDAMKVNASNQNLAKQFLELLVNNPEVITNLLSNALKLTLGNPRTVNEVFNEYLDNCNKRDLAASSILGRRSNLNILRPYIGHILISDLEFKDLQNMLFELKTSCNNEIRSESYLSGILSLIKLVLKFAKRQNYILSYDSLIEGLELPKGLKKFDKNQRFMSYQKIATAINLFNDVRYYVLLTMVLTGLRPQEVLALKIQDIDFENNRINVTHAVKLIDENKGKKGMRPKNRYHLGETKNEGSKRAVPMCEFLNWKLEEWIDGYQNSFLKRKAERNGFGDLLFVNNRGNLYNPSSFLHAVNPTLNKCEIDELYFTDHGCRHCFATFLINERCDKRIIQQCMGHVTGDNDVIDKHYIADNPEYLETVKPYLSKVETKLREALDKYNETYYENERIDKENEEFIKNNVIEGSLRERLTEFGLIKEEPAVNDNVIKEESAVNDNAIKEELNVTETTCV